MSDILTFRPVRERNPATAPGAYIGFLRKDGIIGRPHHGRRLDMSILTIGVGPAFYVATHFAPISITGVFKRSV